MKTAGFSQDLRRSQIDRIIAELRNVSLIRPQGGWIRTAREILGMNQRQLAARMSISPPSLSRLEKAEIEGVTSIKLLERAASAMHCKLVYMLIPEGGSFDELVNQRAHEVARRAVERASSSMHLEGQGIDPDMQSRQIQQMAQELIRTSDKRIWETPE